VLIDPFDKRPQQAPKANTRSILEQVPAIDRFVFIHAPPDEVEDHARLNKNFFDHVL
jgi:hypothetical protein